MSTECSSPSLGKDGVQARLFLGKKKLKSAKLDIPVSRADDEGKVATQWDALRAAFSHEDQCLLFHLKNHYALVFAMREWSEEIEEEEEVEPIVGANAGESGDGEEGRQTTRSSSATSASAPAPAPRKKLVKRVTRQILTARKGQRPTAWLDFSEVRDQVIGWEGYKIMVLSRGNSFTAQDMRNSNQVDPLGEEEEQLQARLAYLTAL